MAKRSRRVLSAFLPLLIALALAAGFARQWVNVRLQPVNPAQTEPVTVQIPAGASTVEIADLLFKDHLIKDVNVFRYYARYRKLDAELKPGEYQLSAAMSPGEILAKIARGEVVVHKFTIPEGKTVTEIADILAARKIVDKQRFLTLAASSNLAAAYLPAGRKLAEPLEGYLFPDTYEYKSGVTEPEILAMMFARFEKVWTPELQAKAKARGLTIHQVMILASIVEKEAQVARERPVIAGVYTNRYKIGMKLDADPTVAYGVRKPPGQELTGKDLATNSPYNTYLNPGLPPGPIASPGEESIRAVLDPAVHDYLYFVAKEDGSGEHYFATTLAQQEQNIVLADANAAKQK